MEHFFIPTENDFKKWIKDAVRECMQEHLQQFSADKENEEGLLNRKEIAKFLRISLVTLNDWIKRGLPSHPQRGKIYFDKKEVLNYIKEKKMRQLRVGSKLFHIKQQLG
ncbi:helix-turn-helix domain-containing protein [Lacibacter sp.]|uniref:helix-turn-helix domain-containing protein n=1 Tax=Lacibacter sp. TaxID=1915409 RepID=UPI002B4AB87B|nr:helix-turn-helix domain-containing protein [Lacibacter sp.]HLP37776.1 helix-turn-helix domain-containing protein [Lacibacter sp.]